MTTGLIIGIVLAVLVVLAIAAVAFSRGPQARRRRLQRRFGPEYDRAVARHGGDAGAGERELDELLHRYGSRRRPPIPAERAEWFRTQWAEAQAEFVDEPRAALTRAEHLLDDALRERGFPLEDGTERTATALAAAHDPGLAERYRAGHGLDGTAPATDIASTTDTTGTTDTEQARETLLDTRRLFETVLGADGDSERQQHAPVRRRLVGALAGRGGESDGADHGQADVHADTPTHARNVDPDAEGGRS
jgi:hypothetical protein